MPAPTITPLPTPPSRSTDPINFAIEADAFVAALPEFATDANAQATYLDGLATAVDADAAIAEASASIATGAANYKGDYSAGTTYQVGQSVSYAGRRYVAKTINTGVTPVDGANWLVINDGDVVGPASATANGVALYDDTTGKIIKAGPAPSTAGNLLTSNGTTWVSSAPPSSPVAYPQNIQSANYTLVLSDAGKQIFHPASDALARVYTIPANSSVAFPVGTVVLFTVDNNGAIVYININTDTLVFGDGTTGSVAVLPNQTLAAIKVTATKWMANYLYQTGAPVYAGSSIAIAHDISPFVSAYTFNSTTGFGAKYANPATLPTGAGQNVAFSPAGNAIAVTAVAAPVISAYRWSPVGFGAKYTDPATLPAGGNYGVTFSPAGNALAVAHGSSPFVTAYPWSGAGFGTKYADPATLPVGAALGVAFNPAGDAIAVTHLATPFISVYPWNVSTGFGTKYANPATLPANSAIGVAFSPAGDAIAVAGDITPFINAYPWSGAGFGTKYTNPATLPTGNGRGVAFSPAGNAIAVAHTTTPFISAYPWNVSTGFGTKYANPATTPTSSTSLTPNIAFNAAGDALAVAHSLTPFVTAYPWSGAGFGTKYANPVTAVTGAGGGVAFTAV